MRNMYIGRVLGLGCNSDESPFVVYAVSGRSTSSRDRMARMEDDDRVCRVNIGSLNPGSMTEEQKAQAQWIYYDGIIVPRDRNFALVSNGEQTGSILRLIREESMDPVKATGCAMKVLGAERDDYKTPRIAGVLDGEGRAYMSIIEKDGCYSNSGQEGGWVDVRHNIGKAHCVSTYTGNEDSNDVVVPVGPVRLPMWVISMSGKSAQDLANNMYDWMNPELVVCTAAAMWNSYTRRFEVAVRNAKSPR